MLANTSKCAFETNYIRITSSIGKNNNKLINKNNQNKNNAES